MVRLSGLFRESLKSKDYEIVAFLFGKGEARFTELKAHFKKNADWNKPGLDVSLIRRLKALQPEYVERKDKGHQRVYYALTKIARKRLEVEKSDLNEYIEKHYPGLSKYPYCGPGQTLKTFLSTTPSVLFEILAEFFKTGFPEEAELKQINSLFVEYETKVFVSLQEELKQMYERGEDVQKIFGDLEKWVHEKYAEK